jgi:hypothetical protein
MTLLFALFVLAGFLFHFLATFPVPYASRIAWGCWLVASLLWFVTSSGLHVG